jgi:primosomal protein N' (replication factor Y)
LYAQVIIDISHEDVDRPFTYHVPDGLAGTISVGERVTVPFGRGSRPRTGYVIGLSEKLPESAAGYQVKDLARGNGAPAAEENMIRLADWMHTEYGCTMIQALNTVIPVKEKNRPTERKVLCRGDGKAFDSYYDLAVRKKWAARVRILESLRKRDRIPWAAAVRELKATRETVGPMIEAGAVVLTEERTWRDSYSGEKETSPAPAPELNEEQAYAVSEILSGYSGGDTRPCLIHGITGSGKTEVYIRLIDKILKAGKEAIVLIPEISLTYQTVRRFASRFGKLVAIVNSRLSPGEKADQFERAAAGDVRVMIGPRSALFTPFRHLGLIVMDEEHEQAYISEKAPRYHTRETAIRRAELEGALMVMGSATPSLEAYSRAVRGTYRLFRLTKRAVEGSRLSEVSVADMRAELEEGNRSIFSASLQQKIEERLSRHEQVMLYINRRGLSSSVSCRSCGKPIECPHCAVPMTEHGNGRLVCHYCGYSVPVPTVCPSCGSKYLGRFGIGTEKAEILTKKRFPQAAVLRMDSDTTSGKGGHDRILKAFAEHQADILVGTQMIVKGLDFPDVTLVGILAADMSLYAGDFRSAEHTFQLLTQAAGRAGRGNRAGEVVIQTYNPDSFCIRAAASQNYEAFFREEDRWRKLMEYPPEGFLAEVMTSCRDRKLADSWVRKVISLIKSIQHDKIKFIGPADAAVSRIKDFWRRHFYIKTSDRDQFLSALAAVSSLEAEMQREDVYLSVSIL